MLLDAVTRGRLYQVKFLLESGSVNVNVTDHNGQTPMMKAILLDDKMYNTRYKIVRLLLEHGAEVNSADKDGKTALMLAVIHGQKDVTEKILKCSVIDLDLNAIDYNGNTALIHAAQRGHTVIANLLVTSLNRFGLGVDQMNHRGLTAMLEAVRYGHGQCAKVLMVEGSASLTIRDPDYFMNAEEWAVENNLQDLVALIEKTKQHSTPSNSKQNCTSKCETSANQVAVSENPDTDNLVKVVDSGESDVTPRPPRDVIKRPSFRKLSSKTSLIPKIMQTCVDSSVKENKEDSESTKVDDQNSKELIENGPEVCLTNASFMKESVETKSLKDLSPRSESSSLLKKRKSSYLRSANGNPRRCSSAKTEIERLFELYGVQSSTIYRKGYNPTKLPPSGMWTDPNVSLSSSLENLNGFDKESNFFGDSSLRLNSRRSLLSEASTKQMNGKDGRKTSILAQGTVSGLDRRASVFGRKFTAVQGQSRNALEAFGRRPGERRMSMAPRSMERPAPIKRMNTSMSSLVA